MQQQCTSTHVIYIQHLMVHLQLTPETMNAETKLRNKG